ncbi:MAG: tetratricopeptide repeat protein [Cycloclasticus sp.]|nr:tetratricopeptide repeat protein [Cycloclasticus sp.]
MFLRLLIIAIMVAALSSCAHVDSGRTGKKIIMKKPATDPKQLPVEEVFQAVESTPLDAALLFSLLGGELAGQRGEVELAAAFYVDAAERSRDPQVALRAAQIALYTKDFVVASAMVDILIAGASPTLETHRLALAVYLKANNVDKSMQQALLLVEKSEAPLRSALLAIGGIVSRQVDGKVAMAVMAVMAGLVERYPDEAGAHLVQSQIYADRGDFSAAERSVAQALHLDPDWQIPHVHLAQVLEKQNKTEDSLTVLRLASKRFATAQLITAYGQLLAKEGRYQEAKKQLLLALNKTPSHADARFSLALVYLKLNQQEQAKDALKVLYKAGAYKAKAAFYLGQISYQQKANLEALRWFEKVGQAPGYIDAQANIAMIHAKMGELTMAQSVLQRLRNNAPKLAARFYLLEAELLLEAGQNKQAFGLMSQAINEHATDLALRYARSIAATELGELQVAENDLLFILAQDPNNVNALNALGYTLASKTFRFEEARQYLAQALSLMPEDSAIIDSMGWLNYREGQYEEALALLQKAYKKSPQGEIAAHLGETLWMLGRQEEAKKIWQDGLKNDPDDKYLHEVLQRLK